MKNHESKQPTAIATRPPALVPLDTRPSTLAPSPGELHQLVGGTRVQGNGGAGVKTEAERPLIDVKEFAAKLGCCPKHIRRMADSGRCPPSIQLGALRRWNRQVVITGMRKGELASLTVGDVNLSDRAPTVTLRGIHAKNGKRSVIPLRPDVATHVRPRCWRLWV
jgi:integrase